MAHREYETTPLGLRKFVLGQIGVTAGFCVLIFWLLGDIQEPFPPLWLVGALLASVVVAGLLAERVWMRGQPLDPNEQAYSQRQTGLAVLAGQTVRKTWICTMPIILSVLTAFLAGHSGWPILTTAPLGIAVLTFEAWPSLRNVAMTEIMLNSRGAKADVLEAFIRA
jgi:hypothetical protein